MKRIPVSFSATIVFFLVFFGIDGATAQPNWAKRTPVSNDFFIGIGSSPKTAGNTNHIAQARDIALEQIASGIAVTIASEASQSILEQAGVVSETFQSNITSMAKTELEGYELVDSWENDSEYWVYYRLSKSKHREMLERRKRIAAAQAQDFLHQGKGAQEAGQLSLALGLYAQAAKEIGGFQGMGLVAAGAQPDTFIDVDVFVQLRTLLSNIRIQSSPAFIQSKLFGAPEQPIQITVNYFDNEGFQKPVSNLPLAIEVIQGKISHQHVQTTDGQGKTNLNVERTLSTGSVQFKVIPDLKSLAGIDDEGFSRPPFSNINLPNRLISIQVQQVRAFIAADERNMGDLTEELIVANKVKQHLTSDGWTMVNDKGKADFIVNIKATTRKGTMRQNIHTAFATGEIAFIRADSKEEFLRRSVNQTNGGGLSFPNAGEQALERLGEALIEELRNALK